MMCLKISLALMVVVVSAAIVKAEEEEEVIFDTEKCKFSAEMKENLKQCYKDETKEEFDKKTYTLEDFDKEDQNSVALCIAKKDELVKEDDTFDAKVTEERLDKLDASTEIKDALKEALKDCDEKGGEIAVILGCLRKALIKECN